MIDPSTWTPDQKFAVGTVVMVLLLLASWACACIEHKTRALGNARRVPFNDLMHEQASAEAYDDLPDMDVEAGITYGPLPKREPGATLDEFAGEQPGDDTIAAIHDMTVEEFRAKLREQQIAVSAAVAAQRLDVEIFDLLHDAEVES